MSNMSNYQYSDSKFDADESNNFLVSFEVFVGKLEQYIDLASVVISVVGFFTNIFHLAVLTRKSIRNSSVFIFLIGIAICDLVRMISIIVSKSPIFYRVLLSLFIDSTW